MNRKMRLKIEKLSYPLTAILSLAHYLSYISLLNNNMANEGLKNIYSALIALLIAISFSSLREILKIILGKAIGISPIHFFKRYQTNSPIEKSIYRLIKDYIPNLHCLCDIIIKDELKEKYSSYLLIIIEEVMQNTALHSNAARAEINLYVSDEKIKLFLQDDGVGFCVFSLNPTQQQGLTKIKRLTKRIGGTHRMETGEGGTAHWIDIPLTI